MRKLNLQLFAEPAALGVGFGTEPPAAENQPAAQNTNPQASNLFEN